MLSGEGNENGETTTIGLIGHLHDGVILLPRPELFWVFFSYLNLVAPVRFT